MGARIIFLCLLMFTGVQQELTPRQINPGPASPYVERIHKEFKFYPGGKIKVDASIPGNCKVVGWERAMVSVEAEKIVYRLPLDQAKAVSDRYPVRVRWTQTEAAIQTQGPPESLSTMETNLTLYVPKDKTDLAVRLVQGDFEVEGINGWIEANLSDGDIDARSLQGYFSGVTLKGDLNIVMSGRRWLGHGFTAVTQRGSIQLHLPIEYSAALKLETREGEITVQYPEQLVDGERVPLHIVAQKNSRFLEATVGDGGSPIKLMTVVGDLQLEGIKP
jgi:hypothetical protein